MNNVPGWTLLLIFVFLAYQAGRVIDETRKDERHLWGLSLFVSLLSLYAGAASLMAFFR